MNMCFYKILFHNSEVDLGTIIYANQKLWLFITSESGIEKSKAL